MLFDKNMKTTDKVSIGRLAFNIDSDACQLLKDYLDRLERHFTGKESGKEIVSDIEERLSELLAVRLSQPDQVVTRAMVEEVIAIMGMPDDMEDSASSGAIPPTSPAARSGPRYKRLFRDVEHRVIGGVCSGLGAYFNIDAVFVRLFFVLFFFGFFIFDRFFIFSYSNISGTAILAYIVLWIAIPAARTAKDKLVMRGNHHPTIADIEKKMLEDAERPQNNVLVRFIKLIARIFVIFFGAILLVVALSGFLIIPCLFLFEFVPNMTMIELLGYVNIGSYSFWFKLFLTLALLLPFMGLVYIAVKALIGFKGKYKVGLSIFLLWLASIIGLTVVALPALRSYSYRTGVQDKAVLDHTYDTLYINVSEKYKSRHNQMIVDCRNKNGFSALWSVESGGQTSFYLLPQVEIIPTKDSGEIRVVYSRYASGRYKHVVQEKLDQMSPKAFLQDSLLILEPFIFDKKNKWSGEMIKVRIYVPRGKTVKSDMLDRRYKEINIGPRYINIGFDN
jgi:phage shock protein PspC (stress-responsive transcriptional regulator)